MSYSKTLGFSAATFLLLSLTSPLPAQITFQRTYGGADIDKSYSVQQTGDGGYVIAGQTWSAGAGSSDVYVVKTDSFGGLTWTRTYGGTDYDAGYSMAQTADGGYVIAGLTYSFGAGYTDVWLIKTDASGDTMWTRTHGGAGYDIGNSVLQTVDDGYVITGYTYSFGAGWADVWLVKTNASGDTMWTRTYGGADDDYGFSVAQTTDGGYIITGHTESFGADVWLVRTDASGDTLWTRTFGSTGHDYGYSVAQTTDGGYVITGNTTSFGAGEYDIYLVKTDASGDSMWTHTYGGVNSDEAYSVAQTTDGGYIITGRTGSFGAGGWDVWLIKTDASGDTTWTRTFGGTRGDYGESVQQTADGGYAVAGYTGSFGVGNYDAWLIKTDSAGRVAIAEPEPPVAHQPAPATIARAVLHMPETEMTNAQYPMTLLDIAGRCVMELAPGDNDVRHLAPGVYFVRPASSVHKVVVTR